MFYALEQAGYYKGRQSFDVRCKSGAYAGVISDQADGTVKVYFNSNCTRGSKRKFSSRQDAITFIHQRREKRGFNNPAAA